ncbi:MAG: hypothetical protein MI867_12500 [Pseudomonadales bacterium]|nr:hypothetical protein [Pseudomonadales bacterium]
MNNIEDKLLQLIGANIAVIEYMTEQLTHANQRFEAEEITVETLVEIMNDILNTLRKSKKGMVESMHDICPHEYSQLLQRIKDDQQKRILN